MIGTTILHYKIVEKLGEGGMGEVYLARDTKLDRDVALKFLPERVRADSEARERLIREAQAASKLHHSNIVSTFAIENADDKDFIVMEYVAGRPLSALVREGLSMEQAYDIARQVGDAIAAAHDAGIVHRDMKSENVIVTDKGHAKVLDFGLAKLKGSDKITQAGSTLGTMAYMSPEQTQGVDVDHRSDIFSFGVILYEMVTGQLPFKGDHSAAVAYAIVNETPEPLARYKSDVSDELQRIMDKVLRKDPKTRYQSVPDMLADLGLASSTKQSAYMPAVGQKKGGSRRWIAGVVVFALLALFAFYMTQRNPPSTVSEAEAGRVMLAVLPFDNLGATDDEYFADGITEEITTQLAKLSGLGVISRTSAMAYKKTDKSLREIGNELDVDYVLEGTIRWDRSGAQQRVRINPQLIRVSDDTHLWTDSYDRVLDEIFSLQSEIAEEVAEALNVTLLEPERLALEAEPTDNIEAYQYYLRGKEYYAAATDKKDRELAIQMFENAVKVDPEFSLAHAWLARIYANDYFNSMNLDSDPLRKAKAAAENAERFSPGSAEAHLAMGYYHYYGSRDYERALEEFKKALKGEPNNSELLEATGYVQRRLALWEDSAQSLKRAVELDPRATNITDEYIGTLIMMRRYDEVDKVLDRNLALSPNYWPFHMFRAFTAVFGAGDVAKGRVAIDEASKYTDNKELVNFYELIDFLDRDVESAMSRRPHLVGSSLSAEDSTEFYRSRALYYALLDDRENAVLYADSALTLTEAELRLRPEDPQIYMDIGMTYACLGEKEKAIQHGEKGLELWPISKDAVTGPNLVDNMCYIYLILGERELALDQLEYLLSVPSYTSVQFLKLHPAYDSIRDHPRFLRLISETS